MPAISGSSSTTRIVCSRNLPHALVRAAVPVVEVRGQVFQPSGIVASSSPAAPPAPEEAADEQQPEEQPEEAEHSREHPGREHHGTTPERPGPPGAADAQPDEQPDAGADEQA